MTAWFIVAKRADKGHQADKELNSVADSMTQLTTEEKQATGVTPDNLLKEKRHTQNNMHCLVPLKR